MTETPAWERELVVARARRNVAERALREAVNAAALAGAGAAEVARVLRMARPDAERLLAGLERDRGPDGRLPDTAYAIAERYAVGELSREQLLELLVAWPYTPERSTDEWNNLSVLPKGSFTDTVVRAADDGLITDEEYDAIVQALVEQNQRDG